MKSVDASLPYSIPDLDARRDTTIHTNSFTLSNRSLEPPTSRTTHAVTFSGSASGPGPSIPSLEAPTAPFSVLKNTTVWHDAPGTTERLHSSTLNQTSTYSSSRISGSSATSSSFHFSGTSALARSSLRTSSVANITVANITVVPPAPTSTKPENPKDSVQVTTVTASNGTPRVITVTVPASTVTMPNSESDLPTSNRKASSTGIDDIFSGGETPVQPSQTTSKGAHPSASDIPRPFIFDAIIDGLVFHLPSPNEPPIEILLFDGSLATLVANKVSLRGQTLHIPAGLSAAQDISSGGQTIKAQPGKSKKPKSGGGRGGGGGGGVFGALAGLAGAAGSVTSGMANVGKDALSFASSGSGAAAAGLADTFNSAVVGAEDLLSSINGIQESFELEELTEDGIRRVFEAQNLGRQSSNWMRSMGNMIKGFEGLEAQAAQHVRDNIGKYAGAGGGLVAARLAIKAFADFPWKIESSTIQKKPSATLMPSTTGVKEPSSTDSGTESSQTPTVSSSSHTATRTNTAAPVQASQSFSLSQSRAATTAISSTSTSGTTSSSTTSSVRSKPTRHFITTEVNTPLDDFKRFTDELDNSTGTSFSYEHTKRHQYLTMLTDEQAKELPKKYKLIKRLYSTELDPFEEDFEPEEFRAAIPDLTTLSGFQRRKRTSSGPFSVPKSPRSVLDMKLELRSMSRHFFAPWWKKMISSPPDQRLNPSKDPIHKVDDSGGKGTTIYVIDDGFDLTNKDLRDKIAKIKTFFVPTSLTYPESFPQDRRIDMTIGGGAHGTMMATLAGGKHLGVAPKANLYLVKPKNQYRARGPGGVWIEKSYKLQHQALDRALGVVREDIEARLAQDPNTKSVINMSFGTTSEKVGYEEMGPTYEEFFAWTEQSKVTVTMAAGNELSHYLHECVPQRFGTTSNQLVTVGAVDKRGILYQSNTPHQSGQEGSMTVFAPGVDIEVPALNGQLETSSGTSQASAIVAGLAAYFYSLPGLIAHDGIPSPADDMKKFIVAHAWTRARPGLDVPMGWEPYDSLPVVYNLAYGDRTDHSCFVKRDDQTEQACALPSTEVSETPTRYVIGVVT
ncbi:subtilisin-like protein [Amniculicola lignicola CBS 123094]|uniref:Subtilisin-like protein n=1 Tax=Amniculicola lignicola CBS 123094 TaxID=1392246 RepID=A0A6A5WBL4_9PLEO|nr:subtilisin-like protein [Amniculicola lignicola CBS 123094]